MINKSMKIKDILKECICEVDTHYKSAAEKWITDLIRTEFDSTTNDVLGDSEKKQIIEYTRILGYEALANEMNNDLI